jgi:hypothetical protein
MLLKYSDFKAFVTGRQLSAQYIDADGKYYLKAFDGYFSVECNLVKADDVSDVADFESSLKPNGNKSPAIAIQSVPAFGSKSFVHNGVLKKLYARNTGIQQALTAGSNTISFPITYAWVKIIGVEVVNAEALDYVDLKIKDTAQGSYSGVPNYVLNQFAYSHNIPKDYYIRSAQFDADLYVGMSVEVTYNSVSAKTVGLNFIINEVKS